MNQTATATTSTTENKCKAKILIRDGRDSFVLEQV